MRVELEVDLEEVGRATGRCLGGCFRAFWVVVCMDLWSMFYGVGITM